MRAEPLIIGAYALAAVAIVAWLQGSARGAVAAFAGAAITAILADWYEQRGR
jgi:ABC-type enterobactin transport system permease subunit